MTVDIENLYRTDRIATGVRGFGAIGDAERAMFEEQGYLVVEEAFGAEAVGEALDGLEDLIAGRNPDFEGVQVEPAVKDDASAAGEGKSNVVRKLFAFAAYDSRLQTLCEDAALLGVLRDLMGDTPVLFQDMALLKPARIGSEKPWHQDCAYFNHDVTARVIGAWIALDEATTNNGCMHIIPASHREGPRVHFARRDWQVCDTDVPVDRAVAVPLQPGGCLLFHGLLLHGTPPNRSDKRRRALQFHYKPEGAGSITTEERAEIFGSEGKDVTC